MQIQTEAGPDELDDELDYVARYERSIAAVRAARQIEQDIASRRKTRTHLAWPHQPDWHGDPAT